MRAGTISTRAEASDRELVEAVRAGDDAAFEELYRRYRPRIAAYVSGMVRDPARAEDLAQDAFFSALRRMRATDSEIAFKPWIFEIARNAAIDHWRRTTRAEEISVDEGTRLRESDRVRLTGSAAPDAAYVEKERLEHLQGAFDELSDVHHRILVLRELEGLSYREIGEQLDLTESSVQSALFRARRRLETEYADISEGRRCVAMRAAMGRIAEGVGHKRDAGRLARHARRCHVCRRRARELGLDLVPPLTRLRRRAAALLPLPLLSGRGAESSGAASVGQGAGAASGMLSGGAQVGAVVAERAAALVAAVAIAGGGAVAVDGTDVFDRDRGGVQPPASEQRATDSGATAAAGRSPAAGRHPRGRGAARAAGLRAPGGSRPGTAADGPRPELDGAGPATGVNAPGVPGATRDPERPAAGGDVQSPLPPDVSDGGVPNTPAGGVPKLPEPPSSPSVKAPRVPAEPDVPLEAPTVEPPPAPPVQPPAVPNVPPVDPGVQPDAVTGIGGG